MDTPVSADVETPTTGPATAAARAPITNRRRNIASRLLFLPAPPAGGDRRLRQPATGGMLGVSRPKSEGSGPGSGPGSAPRPGPSGWTGRIGISGDNPWG